MVRVLHTSFPIDNSKSLENLVEVISDWIANGRYRNIQKSELQGIDQEGFGFEKGHVKVNSVRYETSENRLYGVRLIEKSDAIRTTDIVGNKSGGQFNVSLSHNYEAEKLGDSYGCILMPNIPREIIRTLGGGLDGTKLITNAKPYFIKEEELKSVAEIIRNETKNKLPVIYLSKNTFGKTLVNNPNRLADYLAGMAHVLVEPSLNFSFKLKKLTNRKNTYGGALGIHWPNGLRKYILSECNIKSVGKELYEIIRKYSLNILVPENQDFNGILSIQNQKKLGDLKEQYASNQIQLSERQTQLEEKNNLLEKEQKNAKDKEENIKNLSQIIKEKDKNVGDMNDILALADVELNAKANKIKEISEQNRNLEQTVASLSNKKLEVGNMLETPKSIPALYSREIEDIVIDALEDYKARVPPESRRADILNAVLEINPKTDKNQKIREGLKRICNGYRKYNEHFAKELRALGFVVEQGSKHVAVYVPDNEKRTVTISCTPSCQNVGKEICSDIEKLLT